MKRLSLDGAWALRYCDDGEGERAGWPTAGVAGTGSIAATVPGDVHLDLARAGVIPEPLFGTSAQECRWMEEKDWWYSYAFALPDDFLPPEATQGRVQICFDGLDTLADVWLNGAPVGCTDNALIGHCIDVTGAIRPGDNLVVVRLDTGLRWARTQDGSRYRWPGDETLAERVWLRRAQFTGGWDWGPRLLTAGIWRSVSLRADESIALTDAHLMTLRADEDWATIRAQYEIDNLTGDTVDVSIDLILDGQGGGTKQLLATLVPGPNLVTDTVHVASPRLWWPNGAGEAYLYGVSTTIYLGETACDAVSFRYGIREIHLDQRPDRDGTGQSFAISVNGRSIYCKGANWVPADSIPANVTAAKHRALLEEAANAHFNMLRVWGGGVYENDAWWDACDELGILVWQDFMFACSAIPDDVPAFAKQVEDEARSVVRRLRNHPSLALWCGNNENQWLAGRSAPETLAYGRRTYHQVLPRICTELDPSRPYWPSSPWGGEDPNSREMGDRHAWDVPLNADLDVRVDYRALGTDHGRFITEYGFLAPPVEDSLRHFVPDDEMHPGSQTWRFHDNTFERGVTKQAISRYFGQRADCLPLNQYLLLAQAYQAEALRYTLGHFRQNRPATMGCLFWMYSDCWGATSGWTIVDYYLNRKPSYYAVRSAFSPVSLAFTREENELFLWLINDRATGVAGQLDYGIGRFDADELRGSGTRAVTIGPDSVLPLADVDLDEVRKRDRPARYYWARYTPTHGEPVQATAFAVDDWAKLRLAAADIGYELSDLGADSYRLTLSSDRFVWGLWLQHLESVRVSDNYLTLLPGLSYDIVVSGPAEAVEAITMTSINDWLA